MVITTPDEIGQPLVESKMAWQTDALGSVLKGPGARLTEKQLQELDTPSVTLGTAEWWNLSALVREQGKALPAELKLQLRDSEFCLVRCACSFRPARDSEVEWARLSIDLWARDSAVQPTAFDIYPRDVYREMQTDLSVKIGPSLKFSELELGLGEMVAKIQFTRLEPIIVATGAQESSPSWDFEKYAGKGVRGSKFVYLIVKRAKDVPAVRVRLNVVAKVKTRHGIFPATLEGLQDRAIQTVCAEVASSDPREPTEKEEPK